jgi:hypothetical protein
MERSRSCKMQKVFCVAAHNVIADSMHLRLAVRHDDFDQEDTVQLRATINDTRKVEDLLFSGSSW